MILLIIRAIVLFLAISCTGFAITITGGWCASITIIDPNKCTDNLGRTNFKVSFNGAWIWLLVGLLWAAFFFLGAL